MQQQFLVSHHFRLDGVSHAYGARSVLSNLSLVVDQHERLGLIGENGAGKSTLLRILAGVEVADSGTVARPLRTGLLWQEVQFAPEETLGTLIETALAEARAIERELADAAAAISADAATVGTLPGAVPGMLPRNAADRYAVALSAAERAEVWTVDARRDEILAGLGVADIPLHRRIGEVSGGQRSRFALAALLLARPAGLVLDEPTNHLDDSAAAFLTGQLLARDGPVIFASHDREFLDEVATTLIDIDPARNGATRFGSGEDSTPSSLVSPGRAPAGIPAPAVVEGSSGRGTYTAYLATKSAERARWERQFSDEQHELKQLKFAVDVTARGFSNRGPRDNERMSYNNKGDYVQAQLGRRVKNARRRLEDLQKTQVRKPPDPLAFSGIPTGWHGLENSGALLQLGEAVVAGRLDVASFVVEPTSRILITGPNGAGKSSLLSVLAGRLALSAGELLRRRGMRIGLLEQDVRWADATLTARWIYDRALGEQRAEATPLVSLGLVAPRDVDRAAGDLSIGQQRRLALALIIANPPHLFLLDEPTNHLSLALASELEEALGSYPGAVVVASHDRWLRSRWNGERVQMESGRLFR
jgi:macrolide transport system ATP-binding/permease protein